jgi:hypothetical protein
MQEFLDNTVKVVQQAYIDHPELDGKLIIRAESENESNNTTWVIPVTKTDGYTDTLLNMVDVAMASRGSVRYAIASLGYMATFESREELEAAQKRIGSLQEFAPTKEVLVVVTAYLDSDPLVASFEVKRGESGKIVDYIRIGKGSTGVPKGRFNDLLNTTKKVNKGESIPDKLKIFAERGLSDFKVEGPDLRMATNDEIASELKKILSKMSSEAHSPNKDDDSSAGHTIH